MKKDGYIKFHGVHDLSSGWYLQMVEEFFQHWEENTSNADINKILELYNVKKYIDSGIRLNNWTDEQVATYKEKCEIIPEMVGRYFGMVSDTNLEELHNAVDHDYLVDFWTLICDYKVYRRITSETMKNLLDSSEIVVWQILRQRPLVDAYGQTVADHLTHNSHTAERLISHYLAAHEHSSYQIHFPVEFTQEMRDGVLADYVESGDANINYLRLLEQAQSTGEFPVTDRLRLKARKKKEILLKKLFEKDEGITFGVEVTIKSIPDGSLEESYGNGVASYIYSREWIAENQDYPTLLNNFIYLFNFVDRCFRWTVVSLESQLGIFERLGYKGKKDYVRGSAFRSKQMRSLLQMGAYNQELGRLGIRLEDIFKWFFEDYLRDEFQITGFTYSPPSEGTTLAEKCKLLSIAMDGILKQYRLFCEDGYIDRELLEMSSEHVVFKNLASLRAEKYAYANSDDLSRELFLLFSDQSMMSYTEKTRDQYQTLPHLLLNEHIQKEDFAQHQLGDLDWLIERGAVQIAVDGRLLINTTRAVVLRDLFFNEVICPQYCEEGIRQQVKELVEVGDMRYENTLFSKPEQSYLNYVLNKAEFSNGLDLRNKYSHGTHSLDENTQQQDYLELLKIMVLIIIKINEELCHKL